MVILSTDDRNQKKQKKSETVTVRCLVTVALADYDSRRENCRLDNGRLGLALDRDCPHAVGRGLVVAKKL